VGCQQASFLRAKKSPVKEPEFQKTLNSRFDKVFDAASSNSCTSQRRKNVTKKIGGSLFGSKSDPPVPLPNKQILDGQGEKRGYYF
jgi:hypothetical protein